MRQKTANKSNRCETKEKTFSICWQCMIHVSYSQRYYAHILRCSSAYFLCLPFGRDGANSIEMWQSSRKLQMRETNCELPFHLLKLNWTKKKYNRRNIRQHTHTHTHSLHTTSNILYICCVHLQSMSMLSAAHPRPLHVQFQFGNRSYTKIHKYILLFVELNETICERVPLCCKNRKHKRQWSQRAWSRAPKITHSHSGAANKFCGVRCMWCNWLKV